MSIDEFDDDECEILFRGTANGQYKGMYVIFEIGRVCDGCAFGFPVSRFFLP